MGGSILLREPDRVGAIVAMVRRTLSTAVPLTVKIRLGYDNAAHLLCRRKTLRYLPLALTAKFGR